MTGRVGLRTDREKLNVVSVHAEPRAPRGRDVSSKIAESLEQFGESIGARDLAYPARVPIGWESALR